MTSVVVDVVVVVVGITASTVVVKGESPKGESVPVIHNGRDYTRNVCIPGMEHWEMLYML